MAKEMVTIYHEAQPSIRADGTVRDEHNLKVAAYARVSTLTEEQENSYETQVNYFQKYIESNPDWINAGIYTDKGKSGRYDTNRPGLMKMIEDAEAGKIDLILIKSISRFFRNCYKAQDTLKRLFDLDVEVRFLEGDISSRDPNAAMIIQLLTSIAENESTSISENVRWTYKKLADQGIRHLGNNRVFGYDEIDGVLTPNENAEIIRFAFEAFADGMAYREIRAKLNEMNVKTMRSHHDLRTENLRKMFRNEIYVGDRLLQKEPPKNPNPNAKRGKNQAVPAYESKYITNDHEPIVSREVWDIVQQKLNRRAELTKLGFKIIDEPHVLLGKVFCEKCGSFMQVKMLRHKGGYQAVWICSDRAKGKKGKGCCNGDLTDKDFMEELDRKLYAESGLVKPEEKKYENIERIDVDDGDLIITIKG